MTSWKEVQKAQTFDMLVRQQENKNNSIFATKHTKEKGRIGFLQNFLSFILEIQYHSQTFKNYILSKSQLSQISLAFFKK